MGYGGADFYRGVDWNVGLLFQLSPANVPSFAAVPYYAQAAVSRLKQLHAKVQEGSWMPAAAWTQLGEDLKALTGQAAQQRKLQQMLDVNIQRHQQAVFRKLGQLQSRAGGVTA